MKMKTDSASWIPETKRSLRLGKVLKGAGVLGLGQGVCYGLSFLRNMILARMLLKTDFGLAAACGLALSLFELVGRMAFNQQIVQSKYGNLLTFQMTAHTFQFVAGCCGSILLLVLSVPLARMFNVPHLWWAFCILAVVPASKGLENLDIYRKQRMLEYFPTVLCQVLPNALVTVLAWPLALYLKDFRVFIVLAVIKATTTALMTHIVAQRPFRLNWNPRFARVIMAFSWPLLVNGFIMFASQQGDQMIVGTAFSLEDLALYSISYSLISIPWFITWQIASPLVLPLLSHVQDLQEEFERRYRLCLEVAALISVMVIFPLELVGERAVTFIYGDKYLGAGRFIILMGGACAFRFLRLAPILAGIARGDTVNQMLANLARLSGLLLAFFAFLSELPVEAVAACSIIGEACALFSTLGRLRIVHGIRFTQSMWAVFFVLCWIALGGWMTYAQNVHVPFIKILLEMLACVILVCISSPFILGALKKEIVSRCKYGK